MARSDYPADRPLVILMGGPLHRRVYWRDELPAPIPYRDAGRRTTKALGDIYKAGCPTPLASACPEVFEWTGKT